MKFELLDDVQLEHLLGGDNERSPGLHQSTIIKDICQKLDPKRFGGELDELGITRMVNGMIYEDILGCALVRRFPGQGERPGEFTKDGITGSPDWLTEDWVLEEYKATDMSSRNCPDDPKFQHWHWQIKGYLTLTGSVTGHARLRVLFGRGDYSEFFSPKQLLSWDLYYTARELHENWQMLVGHARRRGWLKG